MANEGDPGGAAAAPTPQADRVAAARKALLAAARSGDLAAVESILLSARDSSGSVESIVINAKEPEYPRKSALQLAARAGHVDVVRALLDASARIGTAVYDAAQGGNAAVVELLLQRGAEAYTYDGRDTPMHVAATPEVVDALVAAGGRVNAGGEDDDETPLMRVIRAADVPDPDGERFVCADRLAVARRLLHHGANVTRQTRMFHTALHFAAADCRPGAAQLFREMLSLSGPSPDLVDGNNCTLLHWAVSSFQMHINRGAESWGEVVEIVKALIEAGGDVNAIGCECHADLRRPIHCLSFPPPRRRRGQFPNMIVERSPLRWARHRAKVLVLRLLVDAGADLSAVDADGVTAVMTSLRGLDPPRWDEWGPYDDLYRPPLEERPGPAEFASALVRVGATAGAPPSSVCRTCVERDEVRAVLAGAALESKRVKNARAVVSEKRAAIAAKRQALLS